MKPIFLSSKSSHQDLLHYNKSLFEQLMSEYHGVAYDVIEPDFSNIPELFNDEEKLVLFNHFSLEDGFTKFSTQLPNFKNVKYLLSPYSAYEGLDLELLKKLGIHYRNNGGANAKSVAQYAITAMFMLLSKFPVFLREMKFPDGSILGEERFGKTAGIIGMGNVGVEILDTLTKLGIPTVYYNRKQKDVNAKMVSLEEIFNQDIIFISIATNADSVKLLESIPSLIQQKNYIIDISAAEELYDKQKIVDLLNQDKLKGYALEVFDTDTKLSSNKNLLVTPHIAWCTSDAEKRTVDNYLQRALQILRGETNSIDFIV